ncbi:MAG TPA: CBS domain-containing protein [Gemmatales bacterium]|nr:CBS domain-containing protein [Gemmatales bacterium]
MDLAKSLKVDSVARVELSPPVALDPSATVADAVALMRERRVGYVLICQERRVLGIFTERDLIHRVLEPGREMSLALSAVMTPEPLTVRRSEPIGAALRHMLKGGCRRMPVVDGSSHVVGVLSVKRIVRYLVEHFATTIYNLPPATATEPPLREGA